MSQQKTVTVRRAIALGVGSMVGEIGAGVNILNILKWSGVSVDRMCEIGAGVSVDRRQ